MSKNPTIHASGTRKRAIARATLSPGSGKVTVNKVDINIHGNRLNRARIMEPLILAGDVAKKYDVSLRIIGGGSAGQADAARLAIGRALTKVDEKFKQLLLDYDRTLFVADVRRKEPGKPNHHGKARSTRQKSYR